MRAVVVTNAAEDASFQVQRDFPIPVPGRFQVLVQVRACALTPLDLQVLRGTWAAITPPTPFVPGCGVAGVVCRLGADVEGFDVGDEVVALCPLDVCGAFCEFSAQSITNTVKKPAVVSHDRAASALVAGVRAYTALHSLLRVIPGESVLVCRGASAYGHIAIQLASLVGARVITTASTPEEANFICSLQAHVDVRALVIDLTKESLVAGVMRLTDGRGVDTILEDLPCVHVPGGGGKPDLSEKVDFIRCLAVHGRWATCTPSLRLDEHETRLLMLKGASLCFLFEQSWVLAGYEQGRFLHIMSHLMERLAQEQLKPYTKTFLLEQIREAHQSLRVDQLGSVVLTVNTQFPRTALH
eukprot:gnl/Spiro4/13355_TR7109_c0_g1_i1.p1 gnl/Spiro4/13355_TR7109_c0_g1~~gnl/Spiro4/13355_TR7109_c0_g1_i1.p1  ORF type:complete len:356 (-),score=97.47 gnl/Spiro4/13355_TR7109_c0_g1_i1:118-1185(-)